jgi:hypothetical protein
MELEVASPPVPADALHLRIDFQEVRPDPRTIGLALGYPAGELPEPVAEAIHEIGNRPSSLWSIEGGCLLYPGLVLDRERQRLEVAGLVFEVGKLICGQLSRSETLAVFLCTAGSGIERLIHELALAGDLFTSFIADTMGSIAVDLAMDRIELALAEAMRARGE